MPMNNKYPVSRKDALVVQEANGELLIYDLIAHKAYCLNETSTLIWGLCDGRSSISDISRSVSKKLKSTVDEGLIWLALEQLKKEKLIENDIIPPTGYEAMSRRAVIKKVGLASLIALPVVSALVAPAAIQAASACGATANGGPSPGCPATGLAPGCMSCCCIGPGAGGTSNTCGAAGAIAPGNLCTSDCRCASMNCIGGGGLSICV